MLGDLPAILESAIAAATAPAGPLRKAAASTVQYGLDAASDTAAYHLWMQRTAPERHRRVTAVQAELAQRVDAPTISVAVPVYRPDPDMLRACVRSVLHQSYERWELCLCDDASPDDGATASLLQELCALDSRIRVTALEENGGISAASNAAAALATGAYLAFLDQDDELESGVLGDIALAAVEQADADVIYTDQDKLDELGQRVEPYFKPDWSPDLLLSNMYLGHLLVVRKSLFDAVGGLRSAFDGSQDYDLALRATEKARRIVHVPVVGYHWRRTAGSTALDYHAKPDADLAARRALAEALDRRNEPGIVESGLTPSTFRVRRHLPDPAPLVSVIIPFHDGATLLRKCVDSILSLAGHPRWEVLLVDNRSWEPETRALIKKFGDYDGVTILRYDEPFNWSAINNWAAERSRGDVLLFMNSDVEGRVDGWMASMVEHVVRPEVGTVGARLLYPDGRVQHAGIVLGLGGGVATHAFLYCPEDNPGYFGHAKIIRNYSGVTGACMMVRRSVFEEVDGFDESLPVAFNDVDFCIRLREAGYLHVYTPFAELTHYEGATRGRSALEIEESVEMFRRWGHRLRQDPYFNPNLSPIRTEFQVATGMEEVPEWATIG